MYQGLRVLPELLSEVCGGFVRSSCVTLSVLVLSDLAAGGSQVSSQSSLSITCCSVLSSSSSLLPALQQPIIVMHIHQWEKLFSLYLEGQHQTVTLGKHGVSYLGLTSGLYIRASSWRSLPGSLAGFAGYFDCFWRVRICRGDDVYQVPQWSTFPRTPAT